MARGIAVNESVALEIVREAVDDGVAELGRDDLLQDVGVDSIAGFEIRLLIRERCGVEIAEEEFDGLRSVGDLLDLLRGQTADPC